MAGIPAEAMSPGRERTVRALFPDAEKRALTAVFSQPYFSLKSGFHTK